MVKVGGKELVLTSDQQIIFNEAKTSISKYRQAAIHLYPGGGKSYILAKLIQDAKDNYGDTSKFNVLYISKPGSCSRVQSLYSDVYWEECMNYITFNQLQRNEKEVDLLKLDDIHIIAIDEAHSSLAPKTYLGIEYIIKKYPNAIIIAMSANDKRYDARRWIFDYLTPNLKQGVDYQDRCLKWAVENDKICDFVYKSCNITRLKTYCDVIKKLKEQGVIFNDYATEIANAENLINEYLHNTFDRIANFLYNDIRVIGCDGKDGDRWFVFFNMIDELQESIDAVKHMFEKAYAGFDVKINIVEYHNRIYNEKEATDLLNGEPTPGQVDVIMTCLKGGESFHPKNTRGIIMNRNSGSEINVTQMLGRPLENKCICNNKKLIYDIVGNMLTANILQSVFNGYDKPDDRRMMSILNNLSNSTKLSQELEDKYGKTIIVDILDDDLENMLEDFNEIGNHIERVLDARVISNVLRDEELNHDSYIHPLVALKNFDERNKSKTFKLLDKMKTLQKLFIQGYFGEYSVLDPVVQNEYFTIYGLLGDKLYMTPETINGKSKFKLTDLIDIAQQVKNYDYNYKTRICHVKDLNNKIAELRAANLDGTLCESFQRFCERNIIDINGEHTNLISTVICSTIAKSNIDILNKFKSVVKYMNKIENEKNNYTNEEYMSNVYTALAKEHVFTTMYGHTEFGIQASNAIRLTYRSILKQARKMINTIDYENATRDILGIKRIRAFSKDINNTTKYCESFGDEYELCIIKLALRIEKDTLGKYEIYVVEELGIGKYYGSYKNAVNKLIESTPFGILYNDFINNKTRTSYNRLSRYNKVELPNYYKKMLRTNVFKQSKDEIAKSDLLNKDNKDIKNIVSELIYVKEQDIAKIREAITNKEIDARKLLIYTIPDKLYNTNKKFIDTVMLVPLKRMSRNDVNKIIDIFIAILPYNHVIIKNLINCKLIPEEQLDLANYLLSIAQCNN